MPELLFQIVDVLFGVVEFDFYFLSGSVSELVEVEGDDVEYLFFVDFVGDFDFVIFVIKGFLELDFVIVSFSLLIG